MEYDTGKSDGIESSERGYASRIGRGLSNTITNIRDYVSSIGKSSRSYVAGGSMLLTAACAAGPASETNLENLLPEGVNVPVISHEAQQKVGDFLVGLGDVVGNAFGELGKGLEGLTKVLDNGRVRTETMTVDASNYGAQLENAKFYKEGGGVVVDFEGGLTYNGSQLRAGEITGSATLHITLDGTYLGLTHGDLSCYVFPGEDGNGNGANNLTGTWKCYEEQQSPEGGEKPAEAPVVVPEVPDEGKQGGGQAGRGGGPGVEPK